jgi:hypothetical protein
VYREASVFLAERNLQTVMVRLPATANYLAQLPQVADAHVAVNQPRLLKKLMPLLAYTYLLCLFLGVAAIAWILVDADLRAACGCFAAVMALGFACNFGNNIAIALFHTLGVGRYSHVLLATTLLNQFLSLWLIIEIVTRKFGTWKSRPANAHPAESVESLSSP